MVLWEGRNKQYMQDPGFRGGLCAFQMDKRPNDAYLNTYFDVVLHVCAVMT
ncbi:hypothetical protein [Ancylobacter polymorphus]|uniref:Uncharacterized protein n=1 Tax=Ancylobacter polymorphus TaxID=223390 RepID=A0ABU0BEK9_9HYPH|nr:hypothetical protein [Ancylobacter polymorphus]MDQ0304266.1 hypothetical protein [Ancylobacter polymorphus]